MFKQRRKVIATLVLGLAAALVGLWIILRADFWGAKDTSYWVDGYQWGRAASFVVAAANSSNAIRVQADYVCDGSDDDVEISQTIAAAPSTGVDIYLADGTYNVRVNQVNLNKTNLRLRGGRSAIIKLANSQGAGNVVSVTADNCTVSGLTVDGNFSGQRLAWNNYYGIMVSNNAVNAIITGVEIRNVGNDGVMTAGNNHRTQVLDCYVHDCGEGILFQASNYFKAVGNVLVNIGTGSATTQDGIEPAISSHGVIANNVLYNIHGSAVDVFNNSHYNTIANNIIEKYGQCDSGCAAISIEGYTNWCNHNVVIGNTIYDGYGAGVRVQKGVATSIIGNTIQYARDGTLRNGQAIKMENQTSGTTVSGNTVTSCGLGIQSISGGAVITGNFVSSSVSNVQGSGGGNTIVGNRIRSANLGESNILTEGNYNIVADNVVDGVDVNSYGIRSMGDYDIVEGNNVFNLSDSTRYITISGSNTKVRGNRGYVSENSGSATIASGSTSVTVNHGLSFAPVDGEIIVTPTNNLGNASNFWVGSYTATTFQINVNADPGATTATFAWRASKK